MLANNIREEILENLFKLTEEQQQKVLEYIHTLLPGSNSLLRFVNTINKEDLKIMEQAIHEECENIEQSNW